ncbi:HLH DNA binding domain protein [Aspergillus luchuensis IFO 4308]|nr:HLH DNA binding domain protein [Aspergillus luchuensis IFO 4308]
MTNTREDRRLPPLPCVKPLPRGPLDPSNANANATSASRTQLTCPVRSTCSGAEERVVVNESSATSAESSLPEPDESQKAFMWPQDLSSPQILNFIAPTNINRKPPLQQQCGRKRKASMAPAGLDNQRERHRIAEGNRRKNLSQLHRELDSRIHDYFLEQAGWNPSKGLPESKEQIVQAAIFLIDYMVSIIMTLLRQENQMPRQLSEYLTPQMRCMQLQQLVFSLRKQNQIFQQQLRRLQEENQTLVERKKALELQLNLLRPRKSEPLTY